MEENKNVPEIRFEGFTREWETLKFNDVIDTLKSGLSRELSQYDVGVPVIRANNIEDGVLYLDKNIKYWHTEDPKGAKTSDFHIRQNDILVNFINSEAKMGTAALVKDNPKRDTIYTTNILRMRIKEDYNSYFIYYVTFTKKYKDYIKDISKIAVNQSSFTTVDYKKFEFSIPTKIKEQQAIGQFFEKLDSLITLHQEKHQKLLDLKKAMLYKLFPKESERVPEIRFEGFTVEWEKKKLGECFSERIETNPDGELLSVTINEGIKKFIDLNRYDNSNQDKTKYKKVCVGDIPYNSMRMWQGASGYSPYEGIVSPAYTVITPNDGIDSKCFSYLFKRPDIIHLFQLNSKGITSDNWNLKYPVFKEIEVYVSNDIKEQQAIGQYFSKLDELIDLNKQKIDKLKNIKSALLDKMFV